MNKILIIEDDEVEGALMKRIAEKEGFQAVTAKDGLEGLESFRREKPGIVIVDLMLPGIHGMSILKTIKKESPAVEVIIVTGWGNVDVAIEALRAGASDYLTKPMEVSDITAALSRCRTALGESEKIFFKPAILLVEDDATAREELGKVFLKEGWAVHLAGDGEEGLRIFDGTKIDVAITDLQMPKMGGIEFLHEVRKRTHDCEVIVITGYEDEHTAVEAMRSGAINYIRKPLDIDQTIMAVEKALEKLRLKRSMLHRTRALELARAIILRITQENQVVVDIRSTGTQPPRDYARSLLEHLPLGVLVVAPDMKVLYANKYLVEEVGLHPEVVDEKLVRRFYALGLRELTMARIREIVGIYSAPKAPEDNKISMGKYAYVYAVRLMIMDENGGTGAVMLAFRGERPEK